jgi:enterochelin esterase-like enzyme
MKSQKLFVAFAITLAVVSGPRLTAQVQTIVPDPIPGAKPVTVEHIKIHGAALEGNLEGDAVDRDAIVFLPPSYEKDKKRHYPVVYALHGYSIGAEQWSHEIHVPQTIEGAFAKGSQEVIVVLPDSKTVYNGSMYSSSATSGDFENYIAHDVVAYLDAHYRTIPSRQSRGLVGHSMGGYGASRIGMKHPEVFGVLYIMSPCCLSPMAGGFGPPDQMKERAIASEKKVADAKSPADLAAQSPGFAEEPSALLRPANQGRSSGAGDRGEIHGQLTAVVCRSIYRQSEAVPRHRYGRRRSGWTAIRCHQAAHDFRQLRHRKQF